MAIDETTEERAARARRRQDKRTPFLINEADARLYPNTELMRKRPGYRLYHGDPKADLATRKRYLLGLTQRRDVVFDPEAAKAPEFDLNTATVDEMMTFATEQYGVVLDPNMPVAKMRLRVYELSQMTDEQLLAEIGARSGPAIGAQDAANQADGTADQDDPAAAAARVGALGGGLGLPQPVGQPIESAAPLRGGRQPRGQNTSKKAPAADAA